MELRGHTRPYDFHILNPTEGRKVVFEFVFRPCFGSMNQYVWDIQRGPVKLSLRETIFKAATHARVIVMPIREAEERLCVRRC